MKELDELLFSMFTENTGRHFLDSGGAYGRNWERNQGKGAQDFIKEPSAWLEIWHREATEDRQEDWDVSFTLSLFHHLRDALDLDRFCHKFNARPVEDWGSDFYGVSRDGQRWLERMGFEPVGDSFNSYNWSANFTQVVQGQKLTKDGEDYLLLQVHGGCDVRGGYTDAKLFKFHCDPDYFLYESAGFSVEDPENPGEYLSLSWSGEWINNDGCGANDEDIAAFCRAVEKHPEYQGGTWAGDQWEVCV
jgi:hypothetical protein